MRKFSIISIILLFVLLTGSYILLIDLDNKLEDSNISDQRERTSTIETTNSILIYQESHFSDYGIPGIGTEQNPYVIRDYLIENNGTYPGILIEDIDSHVIVSNILVRNCEMGIVFRNTTNGIITNNSIENSESNPIFLSGSYGNTIFNNTFANSTTDEAGILLDKDSSAPYGRSDNNTIINNTIYGCSDGIFISDASDNIIANNTISNCLFIGIAVKRVTDEIVENNTITNNTISECQTGIYLDEPTQNSMKNHFIISNIINDCQYQGIRLTNTENTEIINNQITNSGPSSPALLLEDCDDNYIYSNSIMNNEFNGIQLDDYLNSEIGCHTNTIENNLISNNSKGIYTLYGSDNEIITNSIMNNSQRGIHTYMSSLEYIANNSIECNLITDYGIYLQSTDTAKLELNTINNAANDALILTDAINSKISFNILNKSSDSGIRLIGDTNTSSIAFNEILNSGYNGIYLNTNNWDNIIGANYIFNSANLGIHIYSSYETAITGNTIENTTKHGLLLSDVSENSSVINNSFVKNNLNGNTLGDQQVLDNGTNNIFDYNYYSDWTTPDDIIPFGVVDSPYNIDYYKSGYYNSDPRPRTEKILFSEPTINSPNGGEIINSMLNITWTVSTDNWGWTDIEDTSYFIYLSSDSGTTWELIGVALWKSSLEINTSDYNTGNSYLIKVTTLTTFYESSYDISDDVFTIWNSPRIFIEQPESITVYDWENISLSWKITVVGGYSDHGFEIYRNGSFFGSGQWNSGSNVSFTLTNDEGYYKGGNVYNFTILVEANLSIGEDTQHFISESCSIFVNVIDTINVTKAADMTITEGNNAILWWKVTCIDEVTPDGYIVNINGKLDTGNNWLDNDNITIDFGSELFTGDKNYTITIIFNTLEGATESSIILVEVLPISTTETTTPSTTTDPAPSSASATEETTTLSTSTTPTSTSTTEESTSESETPSDTSSSEILTTDSTTESTTPSSGAQSSPGMTFIVMLTTVLSLIFYRRRK